MAVAPVGVLRSALVLLLALSTSGPLSAQDTGAVEGRKGPSTLRGHVVDHEHRGAISSARVWLIGRIDRDAERALTRTRMSDDDGRFDFEDVESGRYVLSVSALGYVRSVDTVSVDPDMDIRVRVSLSASPLELEPIVVAVPRTSSYMAGFEARRANARTFQGFFLPVDFKKWNAWHVSEMLDRVPGWGLVPGPPGMGGCPPAVWVNGRLFATPPGEPTFYDHFFQTNQVAALEVYSNRLGVPEEFRSSGTCGAVVIWLNRREKRYGAWWRRGLAGAVLLTTLILVTR